MNKLDLLLTRENANSNKQVGPSVNPRKIQSQINYQLTFTMAQNIPTQNNHWHADGPKASIRSLTHIVFTYLSLIITSN